MSDRTPPSSLAAEEAVLGAMLLSREAIDAVAGVVEASDFYRPTHSRLYAVICELHTDAKPADAITVWDALDDDTRGRIGGLDGLLQLQMDTPATSNAANYAAIVASHAVRRRVIAAGAEIVEAGYTAEDGDAAIAAAQAALSRATSSRSSSQLVHLGDAVEAVFERWAAIEAGEVAAGQMVGIGPLDQHLGGLQDGELYVVGALTGAGKTSFGLASAYHVARAGRPVLVVSLEMSAVEIARRQLLALSRSTDPMRILSEDERGRAMDYLGKRALEMCNTALWIDETPEVTVHRIRAQAAALKAEHGHLGLVVVDYLQLVRPAAGGAETRTLELAAITRGLKLLAREVGCPVMALSQLNRRPATARGADALPQLSDLRESGAIEQDAGVVMLLHRPKTSRPEPFASLRPEDVAEPERIIINVAKNRHGAIGRIDAEWYPQWALIAVSTGRELAPDKQRARSAAQNARLPYAD